MLKQNVVDALNEQINKELFSAYLYQAMSAHAAHEGLAGIANWMDVQAKEEMFHARKIYDYVDEQGEKVKLLAIEQPESAFNSVKEMFEKTLEHEKFVTKSIHDLVALARKENDYATEIFLQWFVTEQVEEEATASDLLDKIKLVGDAGNGIYMFDKELAGRTYTAPATEE